MTSLDISHGLESCFYKREEKRIVVRNSEEFLQCEIGLADWESGQPTHTIPYSEIVSSGTLDYWKGIERHLLITNTTRTILDLSYRTNAVKESNLNDNVIHPIPHSPASSSHCIYFGTHMA